MTKKELEKFKKLTSRLCTEEMIENGEAEEVIVDGIRGYLISWMMTVGFTFGPKDIEKHEHKFNLFPKDIKII